MTPVDIGIGARPAHFQPLMEGEHCVDWIEVLGDNFLDRSVPSGVRKLAERYPTAVHCVGLSVGSPQSPCVDYVRSLASLRDTLGAVRISDHLCWTRLGGQHLHELLPLPHTAAAVRRVARHVRQVQDQLQTRISLENAASYMSWAASDLGPAAFVNAVLEEADCDLLLDLNNVYVSACNLGYDAEAFIRALPAARIAQVHIAGHSEHGDYLLDSHDGPVQAPVWDLLELAISVHGAKPVLIEWDADIPSLDVLLSEVDTARSVCHRGLQARAS